MRPLTANLILSVAYAVVIYTSLFISSGDPFQLLGVVGGFVVVIGMMMVKRPGTDTSILRYKKGGLYLPFYIP